MASRRGLTVGGDLSARPPLLLSSRDSATEQGRRDHSGSSLEQGKLLLLCPCQRTVRGVALGAPSVPHRELLPPHTLEHPATVTALCPAPGHPHGVPGEDRGQGGARPGPRETSGQPGTRVYSRGDEEAEGSEVRLWAACADGRVRLWGLRPGRGRTDGYARGGEEEAVPMVLDGKGPETEGEGGGRVGRDRGRGSLVGGAALHRLWDVGAPIESMVVLRMERETSAAQDEAKTKGGKKLKGFEDIAYLSTWRVARGAVHKQRTLGVFAESSKKTAQREGRLMCFSLTRGVPLRFPTALSRVLCRPNPPRLILSPTGALVACCSGPTVLLWRAQDPFRWVKLRHTRQLTCVAVSPCSRHVAAADVSGRVMVWHDVGRERLWGKDTASSQSQTQNHLTASRDTEQGDSGHAPGTPGRRSPVLSKQRRSGDFAALISLQHWHSSAVAALCFSADGAYLLSGGAEAVLLLCQLRTGALRFLPRLGGPITGITPLTPSPQAPVGASTGTAAGSGSGGSTPAVDLGEGGLRFAVQCSGVNAVMLVDMAPMTASLLLQGVLMPPVYPGQLPWPAPQPPIRALLPPQLLPPPWVALGAPVVDPLTGLLILPARGARLQFVDVSEGSFSAPLAVLQVAPRNAVQPVGPSHQRHSLVPGPHGTPQAPTGQIAPSPEPVCVTHIGISPDGLSLFTAEVRMAEGESPPPFSALCASRHYGAYGPSAKGGPRVHPTHTGHTPTLGQGSCLRFWARTLLTAGGSSKGGAPEAHQGPASSTNSSSKSNGGAASGSAFVLNSRVDNPHGAMGAAVAALAVHPGGAVAVTCSSAAPEFKLWCKLQRRSRSSSGRGLKSLRGVHKEGRRGKQAGAGQGEGKQGEAEVEVFCWRCKSVGSFRGPPAGVPGSSVMSSADFSSDGSLLAVASGSCVTLWDPHSCSLLSVLPDPLPPLLPLPFGEPLVHPWLHAVTHVKLVGTGPESLLVTASLCGSGGEGGRAQGKGGRKEASGGAAGAEHWLCVRSVLTLEVLWSVRVRVLGLLGGGGGDGGEREWGGYAGGETEAEAVLRPEMPPECWAALLLLERGEEEGEQGAEGKVKKGNEARNAGNGVGNGVEEEDDGEAVEEEEEEEEEGEEDAEEEDEEVEGEEEEEEGEEEVEEVEETETKEECANGRDGTQANGRKQENFQGPRQRSKQRAPPPVGPRFLPVVAVFEGANPVPIAAWAVPEESSAPGVAQCRKQGREQQRGTHTADPLAPLALGSFFLLPSMSAPWPLDSKSVGSFPEGRIGQDTVAGAGAGAGGGGGIGQRGVELMVVREGGEVLRLSPPGSHSLSRGRDAVYLGGAAMSRSVQHAQQEPANLLEAMFGKQTPDTPVGGQKEALDGDQSSGLGAVELGLSLQSTPSHILPSLSKLLPQFFSQLVDGPPDGS